MQNKLPIGVFDSGIGGTSIWQEIVQLLPHESTIYLADSKNAPYGAKTKEAILQLCIKNTETLLDLGVKVIVVACNTATTNAIAYLRANYAIPFIGIEPAIKPAALQSTHKAIGILATKGTLNSSLFAITSERYTQEVDVIEVIGAGLVPLIEQGKINSVEIRQLLNTYLEPMINANIDHLVLGCSHYPFLSPIIKEILPKGVRIIDSGEAVARQTKAILSQNKLLSKSATTSNTTHQLYSNATIETLGMIIKRFRESGLLFKNIVLEIEHKDF